MDNSNRKHISIHHKLRSRSKRKDSLNFCSQFFLQNFHRTCIVLQGSIIHKPIGVGLKHKFITVEARTTLLHRVASHGSSNLEHHQALLSQDLHSFISWSIKEVLFLHYKAKQPRIHLCSSNQVGIRTLLMLKC